MTSTPRTVEAEIPITRELYDFLMGQGSLNGCEFGDRPITAKGAFWWRDQLRECADRANRAPVDGAEAVAELPEDAAPLSRITWNGTPTGWCKFWRKRDGQWVGFEGRMHPNGEIEYRNGKRSAHNTASHVSPIRPAPSSPDAEMVKALNDACIKIENDRTLWTPEWQIWLVDVRALLSKHGGNQ